MAYEKNSDLPKNVTNYLPDHAQSVFRKAFNSALKTYQDEAQAFKVAWAAVEKEYEKNKIGKWVKKDPENS